MATQDGPKSDPIAIVGMGKHKSLFVLPRLTS